MTRDELIKLAQECHWRRTLYDFLERGLLSIYPGAIGAPDPNVTLWSSEDGTIGDCPLSQLRSINRPWIIGPFSGKFFSLKSQRIWG